MGRCKVTVTAHGVRMGIAGPGGKPGKRAACEGWSRASARSNSAFLKSVIPTLGQGISATLTVGDQIPTFEQWDAIKGAFLDWLRKERNVTAWHWLVEFQARGAPHLHLYVLSDCAPFTAHQIESAWLRYTAHTGSRSRGQHVQVVQNTIGWLKYLDRHGARSVDHYQRDALPEGWTASGRMWGRGGAWLLDVEAVYLDEKSWFRVRRIVHKLLCSQAWAAVRRYEKEGRGQAALAVRRAALRLMRRLRGPVTVSAIRGINDWITDNRDLFRIVVAFGEPERVQPSRPQPDAIAGSDLSSAGTGHADCWLGDDQRPGSEGARHA